MKYSTLLQTVIGNLQAIIYFLSPWLIQWPTYIPLSSPSSPTLQWDCVFMWAHTHTHTCRRFFCRPWCVALSRARILKLSESSLSPIRDSLSRESSFFLMWDSTWWWPCPWRRRKRRRKLTRNKGKAKENREDKKSRIEQKRSFTPGDKKHFCFPALFISLFLFHKEKRKILTSHLLFLPPVKWWLLREHTALMSSIQNLSLVETCHGCFKTATIIQRGICSLTPAAKCGREGWHPHREENNNNACVSLLETWGGDGATPQRNEKNNRGKKQASLKKQRRRSG